LLRSSRIAWAEQAPPGRRRTAEQHHQPVHRVR
jgi:hypothetical protein